MTFDSYLQEHEQVYFRVQEVMIFDGDQFTVDSATPGEFRLYAGDYANTDHYLLMSHEAKQFERVSYDLTIIILDIQDLMFQHFILDFKTDLGAKFSLVNFCQSFLNNLRCVECLEGYTMNYTTITCVKCLTFSSSMGHFCPIINPYNLEYSSEQTVELNQTTTPGRTSNVAFANENYVSSKSALYNLLVSSIPDPGGVFAEMLNINIQFSATVANAILANSELTGPLPVNGLSTRLVTKNDRVYAIFEAFNAFETDQISGSKSGVNLMETDVEEKVNMLFYLPDMSLFVDPNIEIVKSITMSGYSQDEGGLQAFLDGAESINEISHLNVVCAFFYFIKILGPFISKCEMKTMPNGRKIEYGDLGVITSCPFKCLKCATYPYCEECKKGYYLLGETNQCLPCSTACGSYCEDTPNNCVAVPALAFNQNSLQEYSESTLNSDPNHSIDVLDINPPIDLIEISEKCLEVIDDLCVKCAVGYVLTSGECVSCDVQSEYESGGICVKCEHPCESCASNGDCHNCALKYFLEEKTCKLCSDNCQVCFDIEFCSKCEPEYSYVSDSKKCVLKTDIGVLGGIVQDLGSKKGPESILFGYWEENTNFDVKMNALETVEEFVLIENCSIQKGKETCAQCRPGYFADNGGRQCVQCVENCLKCNDARSCEKCKWYSKNVVSLRSDGLCGEIKVSSREYSLLTNT